MGDLADSAGLEDRRAACDPHLASVWIAYRDLAKIARPDDIADRKDSDRNKHKRIILLRHLIDHGDNRECLLRYRLHQDGQHVVIVMQLAVGVCDQGDLLHPRYKPGQCQYRNRPEKADELSSEPCIDRTVAEQAGHPDHPMRPDHDNHQRIEHRIFGGRRRVDQQRGKNQLVIVRDAEDPRQRCCCQNVRYECQHRHKGKDHLHPFARCHLEGFAPQHRLQAKQNVQHQRCEQHDFGQRVPPDSDEIFAHHISRGNRHGRNGVVQEMCCGINEQDRPGNDPCPPHQ